jgi:hypothetical protein
MFDVIIITKDSHKTIDLIIMFWRHLGIDPLILVDTESDPQMYKALNEISARHVTVSKSAPGLPDSMTRAVRMHCKAKWILRLDDDELPNREMVSWITEFVKSDSDKWSVGFTRRQLILMNGELLFAAGGPFKTWADGYHSIIWKLFRPDKVTFTDQIHTPGYINENWLLAPPQCHIMHFEWIVQTYEKRKAKMAQYEAIKPGAAFYTMSLYEHYPREEYDFVPLSDKYEFDFIAYQLGIRAGTLAKENIRVLLEQDREK